MISPLGQAADAQARTLKEEHCYRTKVLISPSESASNLAITAGPTYTLHRLRQLCGKAVVQPDENCCKAMNGSSLQKKRWALTQEAFEKFLACLDTDRERAGQKYEMIRSKLIDFFTWRDCLFPEDHADETINRVIRKIDEGEEIRDPSTYVFGIARMLLLEIAKSQAREQAALSQLPQPQPVEESDSQSDRQVECLKGCLQELPPESRQLIMQYYQGESSVKINNRKKLAEMLGLQSSTLRIRAFRLREKLEACLNECLSRIEKG